ncbi:MAG: hypothetical protein JXQ90_05930 [Cyclobacteriaceae bacterium]
MKNESIKTYQLYLLRAMYLLITVGLGFTIWPEIIDPESSLADSHSVINAILGAFSLLCLLGLRYPLKMLPILLFELLWKTIWVIAFALRMHLGSGLDDYASETLFACLMGIVLTPLAIPWKYVAHKFFKI